MIISYDDLRCHSDCYGYEVGYPEIPIVGLYYLKICPKILFYIDVENSVLLEAFIKEGD